MIPEGQLLRLLRFAVIPLLSVVCVVVDCTAVCDEVASRNNWHMPVAFVLELAFHIFVICGCDVALGPSSHPKPAGESASCWRATGPKQSNMVEGLTAWGIQPHLWFHHLCADLLRIILNTRSNETIGLELKKTAIEHRMQLDPKCP